MGSHFIAEARRAGIAWFPNGSASSKCAGDSFGVSASCHVYLFLVRHLTRLGAELPSSEPMPKICPCGLPLVERLLSTTMESVKLYSNLDADYRLPSIVKEKKVRRTLAAASQSVGFRYYSSCSFFRPQLRNKDRYKEGDQTGEGGEAGPQYSSCCSLLHRHRWGMQLKQDITTELTKQ
ncbi:hypothetical protein ACFE04_011435 [Oxalis oulophora]